MTLQEKVQMHRKLHSWSQEELAPLTDFLPQAFLVFGWGWWRCFAWL